uniref:C-C motif chemokine 5 n=1 Tax=Podarcis muralis TaxID=64176 RepID=A0A670JR29_PODMU
AVKRKSKTCFVFSEAEATPCCIQNSKKAFPKATVKDYFYTSNRCSLPSIVFIFNSGRSACADSNAQWAKDLVSYLDSVMNTTAIPATTTSA